MSTTYLLMMICPFIYMAFLVVATSAPSAAPSTAAAPSAAPSISWFRENYLTQTKNEYFVYTLRRWRMDDNDRDMCPDTHTSAVYFALTGKQLWRHHHHLPRVSVLPPRPPPPPQFPLYISHEIRIIQYTVEHVIWFLYSFTQYCCLLLIQLLSILMASLATMIMIMLVFYQY
jgi:hypothetical protein